MTSLSTALADGEAFLKRTAQMFAVVQEQGVAVHLVFADGDREDGGLHGFDTVCGLRIVGDTQQAGTAWFEVTAMATCKKCRRAARRDVGADDARRVVATLVEALREAQKFVAMLVDI